MNKTCKTVKNEASASSSDESSSGSSSSSSSSSSPEEEVVARKSKGKPGKVSKAAKKPEPAKAKKTNLDLLLDLGTDEPPSSAAAPVLPAATPSLGGFLSPTAAKSDPSAAISTASAAHVPTETAVLLNKMASGGLQVRPTTNLVE